MDLIQLRKTNLNALIQQRGMNQTEFAKTIGLSRTYLNKLFREDGLFKDTTARKIEHKLSLRLGFLDEQDHMGPNQTWQTPNDLEDGVPGIIQTKYISKRTPLEMVQDNFNEWAFGKGFFLRQRVTKKDNLFFYEMQDQSMCPTIEMGGIALIDIGQLEIRAGDMYLINIGGDQNIRRILKTLGEGFILEAGDASYPDQAIPYSDIGKMTIVGRVIWHAPSMK